MQRRLGLAVTFAVAVATGAHAQQPNNSVNVQGLLASCGASKGSIDYLACGQYIAGVGDQMSINAALQGALPPDAWKSVEKLAICGTPSYAAMRQAFINWGPKHPEDWAKPRAVGVVKALRETWPCTAQ